MTNGTNTTSSGTPVAGVFWFGAFLGLLTAASTAAGTTVTLIGLLFTLVGGSFLAWYRPDALKDEKQRAEIVLLVGAIGRGGLVGVLVGFGFQFVRDYWVTPAIYEKYKGLGVAPPVTTITPPAIGGTFRTQSSPDDYTALSGDLQADIDDPKSKLNETDKKLLARMAQDAASIRAVFEQIKKSGTRERMNDRAKSSLDAIIKTSP